ncbi:glycolate oxidase subunit GlcE [Massilia sp. CCM 8733]|uniref:Glycolate oxidase subunit GlcE n=1 Tax=Massilia mucilaginosa TaxID=2609282 RepID=A0ABX0NMK6_9BURK|nr:glycolate oxidase subunit GlcE [Massilia mucilaginosa]NHZ88017.1 glycolate oxidase subunit GlcE [Massilia mucilaginosa]
MEDKVRQIERFRDQVLAAASDGRLLRIRGGGSKDWYGQTSEGDILDTRSYSGIVDYEPTELVITARCGTPLAEIEAALAERNQMLAFEPPHFGINATIGGVVASGLSGPRRASSGALRDFVLGALLMDGKGEVLTFGGQVMKNVAGYDVSRLLAGSMGTLGLMLEHSIKVLPRALCDTTVRFAMDEIDALGRLNEWAGLPLPISASCWHAGVLTLRLSGAQAAVDAAARTLGGEPVEEGAAFWATLREQRHAFFDGAGSLWRLSVPSATGAIILRGAQLIEWGGAQRWLKVDADSAMAQNIRRAVTAVGGHATLFRGGDKSVGVFQPLAPSVARIHQRLKAAFDPSQVFNPGRMY